MSEIPTEEQTASKGRMSRRSFLKRAVAVGVAGLGMMYDSKPVNAQTVAAAAGEISQPLKTEQRIVQEQQVDRVMNTIREFVQERYLTENRVNLDVISQTIKNRSDADLTEWLKPTPTRNGGEELYVQIPDHSLSVIIGENNKSVSFAIDENGGYLPYRDSSIKQGTFTDQDLSMMPAKLANVLIIPNGNTSVDRVIFEPLSEPNLATGVGRTSSLGLHGNSPTADGNICSINIGFANNGYGKASIGLHAPTPS